MKQNNCRTCERPLSIGARCLDCINAEIEDHEMKRLLAKGRKAKMQRMRLKRG